MRFPGPTVAITEAPPILFAEGRGAARMCLAPAQTLNKRREVGSFPTPSYNKLKLLALKGKGKDTSQYSLLNKFLLFFVFSFELICFHIDNRTTQEFPKLG
jgi:hypothetical protein